jgi:hypothetical protein
MKYGKNIYNMVEKGNKVINIAFMSAARHYSA